MSPKRIRAPWAGLLALLVAGGSLVAAPSAQADSNGPTQAELMSKCNNGTRSCIFHPSGDVTLSLGESHQVGDSAYNCTEDPQDSSRRWEDTDGESNTFKVSLRTESTTKILWIASFTVAFERSYSHTWSSSHTEAQTSFLKVPAGEVGWVERAPRLENVQGTFELIFKNRYYGHRYWYVPFEATGPAVGESSVRSHHSRPMTAEERAQHCS